jgi:hypothetical protein
MKQIISLILIGMLLSPVALVAQTGVTPAVDTSISTAAGTFLVPYADGTRSNSQSYNEGVMAAEDQHSTFGWGVGGFFAGGLFSWLGTGVAVLIANGSRPTPRYIPEDVEAMNYRNGYGDEARRKNLRSTAIPGVIMSTIWTVLVINAAVQ